MAVWAIGDLQGCYDVTQRLLERIQFDSARDHLWFCGDLVNRGGESLETLRLVHSLRNNATVVLGNHDLSLLAVGQRTPDEQRKVNPDLLRVVTANNAPELLEWLRHQKLFHADRELGWGMVHAGLHPSWTTQHAERYAREIEDKLRGKQFQRLLRNMYGDKPGWSRQLTGMERTRAIINIFTRMRYISPRGRIDFDLKGAPGSQPAGMYPWFAVPGVVNRDLNLVVGHWSTLGMAVCNGVHAIDTGAVWGGRLTAIRIDEPTPTYVQVEGRDVPAEIRAKKIAGTKATKDTTGDSNPTRRSRNRRRRRGNGGSNAMKTTDTIQSGQDNAATNKPVTPV